MCPPGYSFSLHIPLALVGLILRPHCLIESVKTGLDMQQYQVFGGIFLIRCYQVIPLTEDLLSALLFSLCYVFVIVQSPQCFIDLTCTCVFTKPMVSVLCSYTDAVLFLFTSSSSFSFSSPQLPLTCVFLSAPPTPNSD